MESYFNYPNIGLLGQLVNSLGSLTSEEKLKTVCFLRFPEILGILEYYLDLTGYLRSYIHYYTQLESPLQAFMTWLLKRVPKSDQ